MTLTAAGTAKVVRFNWPKYLAVVAILVGARIATALGLPRLVSSALWSIGAAAAFWATTSLVATWWVYDHRQVYDRVAVGLESVGDWASVHAGFDDATQRLALAIGAEPQTVVELSMDAGPSLRRARGGGTTPATPGEADSVPLGTDSLDAVFVTFAAHEIRQLEAQRALFGELRRTLRPGGRLVVTEHLRDLANFAVYGPGAFHFQPATTWIDRADEAGFDLASNLSLTPFVHRMVWR